MASRRYYNQRAGVVPRLMLADVVHYVRRAYFDADSEENLYFLGDFGYADSDGWTPGMLERTLGEELLAVTGLQTREGVPAFLREIQDEGTLFTFIEFCFDHVSVPMRQTDPRQPGRTSITGFDKSNAQDWWRQKVNVFLPHYGDGFELSKGGEVVRIGPQGMGHLLSRELPPQAGQVNNDKLTHAIHTFQLGRSTRAQRRQAVVELANLLEFHNSDVREHLLTQDEKDLSHIANRFALRHHNAEQRDDYGDEFLSWMFFTMLSTIHLIMDLKYRPE